MARSCARSDPSGWVGLQVHGHVAAWGSLEAQKAQRETATHCDIYTSLVQAVLTSVPVISHVLPQPSRKIACPSRKEFSEGLTDGETWGWWGGSAASECEAIFVYMSSHLDKHNSKSVKISALRESLKCFTVRLHTASSTNQYVTICALWHSLPT